MPTIDAPSSTSPDAATAAAPGAPPVLASEGLRSKVTRGSVWTLVGYGSSQVLRLLNNLILWQLLYPEAFGLMAIVTACQMGLAMFSDIGIGPSIVQHKRGDDPAYLNTAWTIQVIREFILCAVACLIATPVAVFYHEPQLAQLLTVAAITSLTSGFLSTRLFTATRTLSLGRLTAIDLVAQVASLVVMIAWAWLRHSIWALIAGNAVYNAVRLLLSHTALPGIRNRLHWDKTCARALLHFGRWIFLSTLLTFLVLQSDRLIFGKLVPMSLLGVYSIATAWAGLPAAVVTRVFSTVLFPLLSRIHNEGTNFARTMRYTRRPWLILAGWSTACLISGGPFLIDLLYGAEAEAAGWIIRVLAVGVWLQSLEAANGISLLALGQSKWLAVGNAAKLAGMVALIPLGFVGFGFPGAVVGFAAAELLHYATTAVGAQRRKVACLRQDLRFSWLVVVTTAGGLAVAHWLAPLVRGLGLRPAKLGTFLELLIVALTASVAWGYAFLLHRQRWTRSERPTVVAEETRPA